MNPQKRKLFYKLDNLKEKEPIVEKIEEKNIVEKVEQPVENIEEVVKPARKKKEV